MALAHYSKGSAPGAAKFLLTYSDKTDPYILTNDGRSFLVMVRSSIAECTSKASIPRNPQPEIVGSFG
jgi:hypothetical protein